MAVSYETLFLGSKVTHKTKLFSGIFAVIIQGFGLIFHQ